MMKVGIIGWGRIGRAIFRIANQSKGFQVVAIDDVNPNTENITYLLQYDSVYGKFDKSVHIEAENLMVVDDKPVYVYHHDSIVDVPWSKHDVDLVIDASGAYGNAVKARNVLNQGVKKVIITHSPKQVIPRSDENRIVDHTIVLGVSEDRYDSARHHVISSSICDATALSPVLKVIDEQIGIAFGFVTTLHPWLSYQNLSDGPSHSWSYPGKVYKHFPLGRAAMSSIIPKPTTAIEATYELLPNLQNKITCFSYRIPTAIVASSDMSLVLAQDADTEGIKKLFRNLEATQHWDTYHNSEDPLVSIDYKLSGYATHIDHRWTEVEENRRLKMVLWYDNEWGYSNQVVNIAKFIEEKGMIKFVPALAEADDTRTRF